MIDYNQAWAILETMEVNSTTSFQYCLRKNHNQDFFVKMLLAMSGLKEEYYHLPST